MAFMFGVLVLLVFGGIWVYQFIQLMSLPDADFPGKYDKILWVVAFVGVFLFAPLAFLYWKTVYASLRAEERRHGKSGPV